MIDQSIIEDILKHADIVDVIASYINVIKKGRNYVAVCPFHDDKNPSMMISKEKQIFKCFVCGTGGNAITFIQKYENISFENAVKKLAEENGMKFFETSAKNDINVKETFESITKDILDVQYKEEGESRNSLVIDRNIEKKKDEEKEKKGCC